MEVAEQTRNNGMAKELYEQLTKPIQQAVASSIKKLMGPMLAQVEKRVGEAFTAGVETLRNVKPVPVASEETGEIYAALAAWQLQRLQVEKNAEVKTPKYSFWYADLSEIIYKTTYGEHGLGNFGMAITHILAGNRVYCRLMHKSGQWLQAYMDLEAADKMQDFASDITYAKRYTMASLLGIAAEDDTDGNPRDQVQLSQKPQPTNGEKLPVLTPGNETWNKVTRAIAKGQVSVAMVTAKYSMREDVKLQLEHIEANAAKK